MSAALSMNEVAQEVGLSRERFRKVWRRWRAELRFPAPLRGDGREGGHYAWDADELAAWKTGRTRALGMIPPQPANDPAYEALDQARLRRQRSRVLELMEAG